MAESRTFNWQTVYSELEVENMGWFWPNLDPDLENAINKLKIHTGSFFDLGTGPGIQADALSRLGFEVLASDISTEAIALAEEKFEGIEFIQDDILDTQINRQFNYVFDRGCFHVFDDIDRIKYISALNRLVLKNGIFFLKCFSNKNPDTGRGPYLYSRENITECFGGEFIIENIIDTVYQGTVEPMPKALFVQMIKK